MTIRYAILCAAAFAAAAAAAPAGAQELKELRVAKQFGISYLPLIVMEQKQLFEKHAKAAGLADTKVTWLQLVAGTAMNDALLSGNLDIATGGQGPFIVIWARTKGGLNVKGLSAMNSMPLYLNTINPAVKTLRDFTDKDRIALPAVKVSYQAVTLHMAAEQAFGAGKHDTLDKLTVSMSHPDGHNAMMSGKSEITAHFTSAPFMYQQLEDPRVKRVLSSYEVIGGPATFNLLWATSKFHDQSPKTYRAFMAALDEAMRLIDADKTAIAKLWIEAEKSKLSQAFIEKILRDPENVFTTTPQNVMKYAEFMHKNGAIKEKPAKWSDMFFPEIHGKPGS